MSSGTEPSTSSHSSSAGDGTLDEGKRYWKAAIAHLAPEKREAAWEFYLDRLESSAAADTLGGVMLLLEAHLAFFDDLPVRLGKAAQQIEAAFQPLRQAAASDATSPTFPGPIPASALRRRWPTFLISSASAAVGAMVVYLALAVFRHSGPPVPTDLTGRADRFMYARTNAIRVEPWSDPATRRPCGVTVLFESAAWTERTAGGGAKVYVPSPVEEVRRDLEALRQASQ